MKVLGLEMNSHPGSLGTSSYGQTRLWRVTHGMKVKNEMMEDAIKLWKEIEKECDQELRVKLPCITMGSLKDDNFRHTVEQFPDEYLYDAQEIMEMYPALKNLPDDYKGLINSDGSGVVMAERSLKAFHGL